MKDAIKLGEYFIDHALYAFDMLGLDSNKKNAKKIIDVILKQVPHLTEISARDVVVIRIINLFIKVTFKYIIHQSTNNCSI